MNEVTDLYASCPKNKAIPCFKNKFSYIIYSILIWNFSFQNWLIRIQLIE